MAEKLKSFEILERPYLCNRLMDFYGTNAKLYREASSIIICGKESQRNNFEFSCDMPNITYRHRQKVTLKIAFFTGSLCLQFAQHPCTVTDTRRTRVVQ